ncbi:DUF1501 domain-containing protein [Ferruginibacter sp. SUN002]|uniref:DUF1501 domain-containing protein n=1 Tax=Ferruginibacter sp. SUN002 TaxID=2937789 RepID=UPI003D35CE8D
MKRRDFIGKAITTAVIPTLVSGFSLKGFAANSLLHRVLASAPPMNDHVLVMVRLTGGNDGLNTVIPIDVYANYYNARTNIAIPENRILALNGVSTMGLHPSMTGMQTMYNEGNLGIVQSVSYPNPNFSHFRATDIWMSGSDSNEVVSSGVAGRYLDYEFPGFPNGYPNSGMADPLAIQIGSVTSLALQGAAVNMGMSISDPTNFYNFLNGVEDPLPSNNAGKELAYIRSVVKQTQQYSAVIKSAALSVTQQVSYPANNSLAAQLKIVARLVKGGLKTRVYMVEHKGFDTHSLQTDTIDTTVGEHANLLGGLSEALKAFQDDLNFLQIEDRVVGMTFSEFGRRIKSNSSGGTDHGAAAPLFIFGKKANATVLGTTPNLPVTATVNDNIAMQYDFRSVYASLLEQWLCVRPTDLQEIMLQNFQSLPIIESLSCNTTTYVFNGNGYWSDTGNWVGGVKPPTNVFGNAEIIIEPQVGGKCILDKAIYQTVSNGARLIVKSAKSFVVEGDFIQN